MCESWVHQMIKIMKDYLSYFFGKHCRGRIILIISHLILIAGTSGEALHPSQFEKPVIISLQQRPRITKRDWLSTCRFGSEVFWSFEFLEACRWADLMAHEHALVLLPARHMFSTYSHIINIADACICTLSFLFFFKNLFATPVNLLANKND